MSRAPVFIVGALRSGTTLLRVTLNEGTFGAFCRPYRWPLRIASGPAYISDMVRKVSAIIGSALFLIVAPGFVAGLVPWWISHWRFETPFLGTPLIRFAGATLIALGITGLLDSFVRFAVQGLGTPAPVFPTRRLVVTGLYRYIRNPMYVAVVIAILGQGLIFGNMALLAYGGLVWLLFHVFVLVYEEPTLTASFGPEYTLFRTGVPRWIPRLTAWKSHPEA
jgi:protein-S-isoprenylcysteine O-methyltransferase Ste14